MSYCTRQDLIDRFSEREILELESNADGGTDIEKVTLAMADASGEIDGYLAGAGYATPLSTVPAIITGYACDIARYRLYDNDATEQVTKRYELAIKFMRAVAKGEVRLTANGLPLDESSSADLVGEASFEGGRQVFSGGGF
jgi:phage gp36-like protein